MQKKNPLKIGWSLKYIEVNVYFYKCMNIEITFFFRFIVLIHMYNFRNDFNDLSLHKSLKVYLYKLMLLTFFLSHILETHLGFR